MTNKPPRHIAIIMDGNGRWARERGLPRIAGHQKGAEALRRVVEGCGEMGVEYLTVYAFSTENWNRPKEEVDALMELLALYLEKEVPELNARNVRLRTMGRTSDLPEKSRSALENAIAQLDGNTGLTLILALSYGSRTEIADAARAMAEKAVSGEIQPADITPELLSQHLYTRDFPDPDLLVRTSGEIRLSNFMLWQLSYSEFHITPVLWPDFGKDQLRLAINDFQGRHRRFGAL